jgi:hypothetical protein
MEPSQKQQQHQQMKQQQSLSDAGYAILRALITVSIPAVLPIM